jgi:hypothetical protein
LRGVAASSGQPHFLTSEFDAFHRERQHPIRRDHELEQFHVRFCFPDAATADAFQERFGRTRLTYSPAPRARAGD